MQKQDAALTEAEWSVIKAIWESEPCTAPEVQDRLRQDTGWTYSTVRTLMDRMAAKGLLLARKSGKMTYYTSAITRRQAQRSELTYALRNAFNGALAPMMECLLDAKDISADELAGLKKIIATHESEKRAGQKSKSPRKDSS